MKWRCAPCELGAQVIVEWNSATTKRNLAVNTAMSIEQVDATIDELQEWLDFPLLPETSQTMRESLRQLLAG